MRTRWLLIALVACGRHGPAATDAPVEDVDAAVGVPRCGGAICRTDQSCVQDACTFSCTGTTVPGEYASLQQALTALAAAGNDATVCLAEATYANDTGQVDIVDTGAHGKTLTIVGLSPDRSRLMRTNLQAGWGKVVLQGVGLEGSTAFDGIDIEAPGTEVDLIGCRITGATGVRVAQKSNLVIDGSEITTSNGDGVIASTTTDGPLSLLIQNSYLHGASVRADGANGFSVNVQMFDNTLMNSTIGVALGDQSTGFLVNNIFTGMSQYALSWHVDGSATVHHNDFWNNTITYAELATEGPNTLNVDCQLDQERIPDLGPMSICRNSGHPGIGPTTDFYNRMRAPQPDLGAVDDP
jgi:hypothetical protein